MRTPKVCPAQPPCLSCKKRRVKCDSAKPCCKRCQKDDIECPGYVRIREWNSFSKAQPSAATSTKTKSVGSKSVDSAGSRDAASDSQPDSLVARIPSWLLSPDTESLLLFDCLRFLNEKQIPTRMPAELPFRRYKCQLVYRHEWPRLFRQLVILTVRTALSVTNHRDPLSNAEICHYRARCFAELKNCIAGAMFESSGFILGYVIMFLITEAINPATESWRYHLEAARKIITLRGGFAKCFQIFPAPRPLLVNYMMIDVFTSTTCSSLFLDKSSIETQLDYVNETVAEDELMSNGNALPQVLLREIVNTTLLRISQRNAEVPLERTFTPQKDFAAILRSLENFDAQSWANKVALYGRTHPQKPTEHASAGFIVGWFTMATCYKSTALLYLLLSCTNPDEESVMPKILSAKETLWRYSELLLEMSDLDPDGPVQTQLWRFLTWPMLVSAYARVGWDVGEESTLQSTERLYTISRGTDRVSLRLWAKCLSAVLAEREKYPEKTLHWDDCLDSRLFAWTGGYPYGQSA